MNQSDIERVLLERLYEPFFRERNGLIIDSIREELGIDETMFSNTVDEMSHKGLIRARTFGGNYEITALGAITAEKEGASPEEITKENQHIRTLVLDHLANIYEEGGSFAEAYIEMMPSDLNVDQNLLVNNLQILEDLRYAESVAGGSYKITYLGLDAVKEWRQRNSFAEEFEQISEQKPQPRGHSLQKLLARVIEKDGWSQEEGVRTSNEEIDVIVFKEREYYLIECKWEKDPIEADVVRELFGKLSNRIGVQGIIVSISGFTEGAVKQAIDYASQRVVLFFGHDDVHSLIYGKSSFNVLLNGKYQKLITKKKISFS
jgi:predicted transcriptional regulator